MPIFVKSHMRRGSVVAAYNRNAVVSDAVARKVGGYKSKRVNSQRKALLRRLNGQQRELSTMILVKKNRNPLGTHESRARKRINDYWG